jgi:predicted phage terminase large subunit-like protein
MTYRMRKSTISFQRRLSREKERRKRGRNSLIEFAAAIDVPGRPLSDDPDEWVFHPVESGFAPHHVLLLRGAEKTITTPHGRAMILMPPGSAKSTYCSVVLPAYAMGRWPGYRIIVASYGTELARKHGRRARQIVRSSAYRAVFHTKLSPESSAAEAWALTNGSEYMAAGILSSITGNRAHGIVIDDPVKGRDEAASEVIRKRTREAYEDDIKTRLLPGGWIILIQTRWHEDDLAGSILPENWAGESGLIRCRDGMDWNVVCVPARADRRDDPLGRAIGDYLWPEWFDHTHWAQFQRVPRTWSALYQQKPAPDTGVLFESGWLRRYDRAPARDALRVYGASDYAVSDGHGDYTVHIVAGIDPDGRMYVLDLWRRQATSDVWVEAFCDLAAHWRPAAWAEETGQIRAGIGPFLDRRMRERAVYVRRLQFPARGDKAVRAQSIIGRMGLAGLYVPADAEWVPAFQAELMRFPHGRHDDQVDALGLLGQLLDIMQAGKAPAVVPQPRGTDTLTLDEVWRLCKPKSNNWRV